MLERPAGKTRQRPFAGDCGPTRARASGAERLQSLRKRLASTEVVGTIKTISREASEMALIAPENLLESIAEFVDRANDKLDRLGMTAPKAVASRKRPAPIVDAAEWTIDEFAERLPISVRRDRLLAKLREVHGGSRSDIPPALERSPAARYLMAPPP
jgi:hypothetical protein